MGEGAKAIKDYERLYYNYLSRAQGQLDGPALRLRFEKMAKWYACRLGPFLPPGRDAVWLDVPCGCGNFLYFLRSMGYHNVSGYDMDPEQVRLARLLDLPALERDAFVVLEDPSRSFDGIVSADFIEHLSRDQALRFIAGCRARLRPGGVLFLRTPCADGPLGSHDVWNDLTHQWAATSNLMRGILEMFGFDRIMILDERPQPYSILNRVRLAAFHSARLLASAFVLALGLSSPAVWSTSMWAVGCVPPGPPEHG